MAYRVPNIFIAGTKASAEEMNENFDYISSVLTSIDPENYGSSFCVNAGQLNNATGAAESLYHIGNSLYIRTNTANGSDDFKATNAYGSIFESLDYDVEVKDIVGSTYRSVVPVLDSSVSTIASVSVTSEDPTHEGWQAFDGNVDTNWSTITGVENADLLISLTERHMIDYYQIKVLLACEWTLYGSSDYETWVELDSYSAVEASIITRKLDLSYNCEHYKLSVKDTSGQLRVRIAEITLYEKNDAGTVKFPETLYVYLKEDGVSGAARAGRIIRKATEPMIANLHDSILPEMINNITPEPYVVSASSNSASAYLVLDGKNNTYWTADPSDSHPWIQIQIPTRISPHWLKLACADTAKAPKTGILYGSNNGVTWVSLCSFTNLKWSGFGESNYIGIPSIGQTFSYFKLECDAPFSQLLEMQLYTISEQSGEYYLGEAKANDIWFKTTSPYSATFYSPAGISASKTDFKGVPIGEVDYDAEGNITAVRSYTYNQNGVNINTETTKEFSGNIVTYDSFDSVFGEKGYVQLPNGLIFQWGKTKIESFDEDSGNGEYIRKFETFSIAFPHECLFFISDLFDMPPGEDNWEANFGVTLTKEGFFYASYGWAVDGNESWFALGR